VDVIGNPIGQIAQMLSGSSPGLPRAFAFPGFGELANFPSNELPRIAQQWQQVPQSVGGELVQTVRQTVAAPAALLGNIQRVFQAASAINKTIRVADIGQNVQKFTTLDRGPLRAVGVTIGAVGAGSFLCPGSATVFGLHMQSDLDGPFWRGIVPLEMLYPASWVPGLQEVSRGSGLISTWGSVYPRTGALTQVHPAKASAVLAMRAASIVTQSAQPHIYTRLRPGGDMRYFETFGAPKWQSLYPIPSTGCITFGENDSVSLTSFGDFKTSGNAGYVWNLWHRYECCQNRGSYMFSVP
jgi:integrating conjugative element protein (TIGR03756 family)